MNLNLTGKNALVGGASKGIGKAVALELASLGANVTLLARTESALQQAVSELDSSQGQTHSYIVVDFSDRTHFKNVLELNLKNKNIDILINNTGGPPGGSISAATPEAFLQAFNNHVLCNQILVQIVLPGMKENKNGRIINIISTSVKQPIDNLGVSNTTRGAVANWAKTMANELGPHNITVNNVLPGFTSTGRLDEIVKNEMNKLNMSEEEVIAKMQDTVPLRRFGRPSEVAGAVAFLASPAGAYISGANLPVDGGRTKSL